MAVNDLSQHSSNPMEVAVGVYKSDDYEQSDDPLGSYPVQEYQTHIARVIQEYKQPSSASPAKQRFVNLDSDMSSEDELQAFDQDDSPKKPPYTTEQMLWQDDGEEEIVDDDGDATGIFDEDEDELAGGNGGEEEDEEMMDQDWEEDEGDGEGEAHRTSDDIDCFAIDEDEEVLSIQHKPLDEQAEIKQEIQDFKAAVPHLADNYTLIDRLGTGTFSSVYKAIDLRYHEVDNTPWLGHHPPESSAHCQSVPQPPGSQVFVAIKRIYVTSGPERIKNELLLMEHCRGCRHVSQVITAFRREDQVAIVMPYHRNADFREYFQDLPMAGLKEYFRCLMRALRDIHRRGIIHRDVKPANFLFDPRTAQGSLCDFGLAQRFDSKVPTFGACLHTNALEDRPHGRYISKNEYSVDTVKNKQAEARWKTKQRGENVGYLDKDTRVPMKANRAGTRGFRAPEVLLKCGQQCGAVDVWSAGIILLFFLTHKFPLFQANDDIEALMEIATILGKVKMEKVATLHSRTFASNVPDIPDKEVTWREFTERLNPDLHTPPTPNLKYYPYTLPSYKLKLQAGVKAADMIDLDEVPDGRHSSMSIDRPSIDMDTGNPLLAPSPTSPTSPSDPASISKPAPTTTTTATMESTYKKDIDDALSLLVRLLEPESVKRITPRDALYHPFLLEKHPGKKKQDDDYEPHPFGQGPACKDLHFVDAVTEQPGVIIRVPKCVCGCGGEECGEGGGVEEVRKLVSAGEGVAIGNQPCEFHRDMVR